jgi:hypothetical protein
LPLTASLIRYHFFNNQLEYLPTNSTRVIHLIRACTLFLTPWTSAAYLVAAKAAAEKTAAEKAAAEKAAVDGRSWAGFVKRNYLMYARLLTSVAKEVTLDRFEFDPDCV